jgi:hypothetical protein
VAEASGAMRFAERMLRGVGDDGGRDEIVIWIERRPGAVWAVGRAINPRERNLKTRKHDYIFEGYELGDALEAANGALLDDLRISVEEGLVETIEPFQEDELLKPLERWFFGHEHRPPGARPPSR